jgi:hypothetical protein
MLQRARAGQPIGLGELANQDHSDAGRAGELVELEQLGVLPHRRSRRCVALHTVDDDQLAAGVPTVRAQHVAQQKAWQLFQIADAGIAPRQRDGALRFLLRPVTGELRCALEEPTLALLGQD